MEQPSNRHNGGPLMDEQARKLWDHVRAIENIEEQEADLRLDKSARKDLAKQDGFDPNILMTIVKRRKLGEGQTRQADTLIKLYEEALEDQGALPLEQTRISQPRRRTTEEIAEHLHGQPAPDGVRPSQEERDDGE